MADDSSRFELDELLVTGVTHEIDAWSMTKNISVITAEEIAQATSNNVTDLLAREAGFNLRSLFGNDKFSGVDIRGMGNTSTSNVIILIDGVRINAPDLSGADLSAISLNEIERIEILRGSGAVRYGDGAIGGVINIRTKSGNQQPQTSAYASYGGFNTSDIRLQTGIAADIGSVDVRFSAYNSDGHRNNNHLKKRDFSTSLILKPYQGLTLDASVRLHKDKYGLPGPVSKEAYQTEIGRKSSDHPLDSGETIDRFWHVGLQYQHDQLGKISLRSRWRNRDNPFVLGATPLLGVMENNRGKIDEKTLNLEVNYDNQFEIGPVNIGLGAGFNYINSDYVSFRNGFVVADQSTRQFLDLNRKAYFIDTVLSYKSLSLSFGYRKDQTNLGKVKENYKELCDFIFVGRFPVKTNCHNNWQLADQKQSEWNNHAFEYGINYRFNDYFSVYGNYGRSFRNPNLDEIALTESSLTPQISRQYEVGIRARWLPYVETSLALFRIKSNNEILFDGEVNTNSTEPILREGLELEIKLYPADFVYLWGNYSYLDARFQQSKAFIPLVPRQKWSLGAELYITDSSVLAITATYVGERKDGNDIKSGLYDKVPSYQLVDIKASHDFGYVKFFAGVNNVLDEVYTTSAYSESYYPMPERHWYGGIEVQFN